MRKVIADKFTRTLDKRCSAKAESVQVVTKKVVYVWEDDD